MRQLARMRNLGAGDWPNLLGSDGNDRSRPAGEGNELDLVSLPAGVNVNDRSDVAGLKTLFGKRCGQNDSIVFVYHVGTLLGGMGCDQSWFVGSAVDDPDRPNRRRTPVRANDSSLDSVFGAIASLRH